MFLERTEPLSCKLYAIYNTGRWTKPRHPAIPYVYHTNTFNTEGLLRMLSHLFASRFVSKHL